MSDVEEELLDALFGAMRDFEAQTTERVQTVRLHPAEWVMLQRSEFFAGRWVVGMPVMGAFFEPTSAIPQGTAIFFSSNMRLRAEVILRKPRTVWQRLIREAL